MNRLLLNNVDAVGVGWGAWAGTHPGYLREQWDELEPLLASGKVSAPQPEIYPLERAADAIASLENRTAKGKVVVKTPVRLLRRRRSVPVGRSTRQRVSGRMPRPPDSVDRDELTLSTFNIWFDSKHAEQRYLAIAELLSRRTPDIMVFQEVTPAALDVFLAQPWIRDGYLRVAVVGGDVGDYGMLMLSRLPISRVTYTRLPTRQ